MSYSYKMQGNHVCGDCNSFPICSKVIIKNAQPETNSCQWEVDYFTKKEKKDG